MTNTYSLVKIKNIGIYLISLLIVSFTFHNIWKFSADVKLIVVLASLLVFLYYRVKISNKLIIAFGVFSILVFAQGILIGYNLKTHITSFYFNIFLVYIILRILPDNYYKYIANVIFYLSVISFILWIISNIDPSFGTYVVDFAIKYNLDPIPMEYGSPEQILIFTYEKESQFGIMRNAGFAHEPGAYAVALIFAITIYYVIEGKLFSKKNLFLILCLVTTFSSAGYLSFYILLLLLFYQHKTSLLMKFIFGVFGISLLLYSYYSLDFMQTKIANQTYSAFNNELTDATDGRIYASRKALVVLTKYPLTGRGLLSISAEKDIFSEEAVGYGFPAFASQIGIPLFILFVFLFYNSVKSIVIQNNRTQKTTFILVLAFVPVLFAQAFLPSLLFSLIAFTNFFKYGQVVVPQKQKHLKNRNFITIE